MMNQGIASNQIVTERHRQKNYLRSPAEGFEIAAECRGELPGSGRASGIVF
jgi:hypothetical protein